MQTQAFVVQPWQSGWCPSFLLDVPRGELTVTLVGPDVAKEVTRGFTITDGMPHVTIVVSPASEVQFGAEIPGTFDNCRGYPVMTAPPSG